MRFSASNGIIIWDFQHLWNKSLYLQINNGHRKQIVSLKPSLLYVVTNPFSGQAKVVVMLDALDHCVKQQLVSNFFAAGGAAPSLAERAGYTAPAV